MFHYPHRQQIAYRKLVGRVLYTFPESRALLVTITTVASTTMPALNLKRFLSSSPPIRSDFKLDKGL